MPVHKTGTGPFAKMSLPERQNVIQENTNSGKRPDRRFDPQRNHLPKATYFRCSASWQEKETVHAEVQEAGRQLQCHEASCIWSDDVVFELFMSVMFSWLHLLAVAQAQQQKHETALKARACKSCGKIQLERNGDVFSMFSQPRSMLKKHSQRLFAEQGCSCSKSLLQRWSPAHAARVSFKS